MIETKGVKQEKVRAAFEYAEIFVAESKRYEVIEDDGKESIPSPPWRKYW